jgi:predicted acyl esterase
MVERRRLASAIALCALWAWGCQSEIVGGDDPALDAGSERDDGGGLDRPCTPSCQERECGDDGCGGDCGACGAGGACDRPSGRCAARAETGVPTRDGLLLWTRVSLPDVVQDGGVPAVLIRTPYRFPELAPDDGWRTDLEAFFGARGYALVQQDCRGRFGSEGTFEPYRHEIEDGQDTTAWIVSQPWSNGRVGTIGGSYEGYTAVTAAVDNPDVVVVVADDAPEDESFTLRGGVPGAFLLGWLYLLEFGDFPDDDLWVEITNTHDLTTADVDVIGRVDAHWQEFLTADGPVRFPWDSPLQDRYAETCVPLLSVQSAESGWFDPIRIWDGFVTQGCAEHRADHHLVMTPEGHVHHLGLLGYEETPVNRLMMDMLDAWLGERPVDLAGVPPVQFRSSHEDEARGADGWDVADSALTLHLAGDGAAFEGGLELDAPGAGFGDVLSVDPETMDPCASDYPYLYYESGPLAASTYVLGSAWAELEVAATTPDADVWVTLYDVDATAEQPYEVVGSAGVRARYRESSDPLPLEPGVPVRVFIELPPMAHEFRAGSRIGVAVGEGMCLYSENPHTGEPTASQTRFEPTMLTVFHDIDRPSFVLLPVLTP